MSDVEQSLEDSSYPYFLSVEGVVWASEDGPSIVQAYSPPPCVSLSLCHPPLFLLMFSGSS